MSPTVNLPIRPKAAAFDLDGTLLDYEGVLADSVVRSVKLVSRAGVRVFIVTGRLQNSAEKFWRRLELDTPVASCNGACIAFPGGEEIRHLRLADEVRRKIVAIDAGSDLHFNYAVDDVVYSLKNGEERAYYSKGFSPVSLATGPEDILARNGPTKCLCITSEERQPEVLAMLRKELGGGAEITTSNSRFIEIMTPGVNKGGALGILAEWLGAGVEDFIAVGDAMNDVPMLERAGFAISFKSGDPRMVEYADMLIPPLWEDGMDVLAGCVLGIRSSGRFLTPRSSRFYTK